MTAENFQLLVSDDWRDYELLDSGDMRKLERFGKVRVNRPDPQALWKPKTPVLSWKADATFASKDDEDDRGAWTFAGKPPADEWPIGWDALKLNARLAAFRHMGVFPEHSVHWRWAADQVKAANRPVKGLNCAWKATRCRSWPSILARRCLCIRARPCGLQRPPTARPWKAANTWCVMP